MLIGSAYQWPSRIEAFHDRLGENVLPVAGGGRGVEIGEVAVVDELVELLAGIELHHGGRVAADDAIDARRARGLAAAAGDRRIDPFAAGLVIGVGEHLHGGGFASGGPPVDHFCFLGIGRQGRRRS